MLYVSGIEMMIKKAGTAISNRSHSIFFKEEDMSTPTMMSAGAVTSTVMTARSGEKNNASKKNPAVTTDANPVRTSTPTPAVYSKYDVVVDVPITAPNTVAVESAINAFPVRGNLLSFINPA